MAATTVTPPTVAEHDERDMVRGKEIVQLVRDELASLRKEFKLSQQMAWQGAGLSRNLHPLRNALQEAAIPVALRALPVVILGGLTSVPGAIIGGLIIGVGEKLSEVFLGPYVGGGIEIWFAYVLALGFLLVRPQGLFGEKIIDRV